MTAQILHFALSILVALWMLTWLGNWTCRLLLDMTGLIRARDERSRIAAAQEAARAGEEQRQPSGIVAEAPNVGGVIGGLERFLIAAGIIFGSWEIVAAVVALKSVARFKELDEKLDAEYFLVGSMFSLAWAGVVTKLWIAYDQCWGLNIAARLANPSG